MSKLLILAIIALVFTGFMLNKPSQKLESAMDSDLPADAVASFNQYLATFGKAYPNGEEYYYRLAIYTQNMIQIQYENAMQDEYVLGETQFTDLTREEFVQTYLGTLPEETGDFETEYTVTAAVDWRAKGAVQRVKNQGQCGSCWAFSAIATVEGYDKTVKGTLGDFSEQQLVDCAKDNYGCNGGWPNKALNYVKTNGISTESEYPYVGKDQACKKQGGAFKIGSVRSNSGCPSLVADLATQPTSVCVDASNWSSYKSGIFSNCGTSTNHAVLAVGYDDAGNWIIKNSWGTSWGVQGYITLKTGNTCNVCSQLANAL